MSLPCIPSTRSRYASVLLAVVSLLLGLCAAANASVVYNQDPVNNAPSRISDWSDNKQKADDFILLSGPCVITKISWWGSYGADPDPAVDNYVFKFFSQDPSMPGFPFYECLADGTRYVRSYSAADYSRVATTMVSIPSGAHDGGTVYAYSATLDTPIALEGGRKYWLAITNSTPSCAYPSLPNSKWGWLESSSGSQFYRMGHCPDCEDDWSASYTNNLAFSLEALPVLTGCKYAANGMAVTGLDAYVTAAFDGFFYARADDRTCGIRVNAPDHTLIAGNKVHIVGQVDTDGDGEQCIAATSADPVAGSATTAPLGTSVRSLGGTLLGRQTGIKDGKGLNNIGMLVRICGKVQAVDTTTPAGWFTLSDGTGVVKVIVGPDASAPSAGQKAIVTGISSCEKSGSDLVSVVRIPKGVGITKLN